MSANEEDGFGERLAENYFLSSDCLPRSIGNIELTVDYLFVEVLYGRKWA